MRPNIVITIADDQRFDTIAALGNSDIRTPHLDRMTREGTAFTQAHHQGSMQPAVCVPARAALLTGRTLFHLPPNLLSEHHTASAPEQHVPLLPELLRENGYHTHGIGKWHNGKPAFARSFESGGKIFFGGMDDHYATPVFDFDSSGEYSEEKKCVQDAHSTDIFTDAAVDFLENYEGAEPFFLFVAYTAPHDPRTPPPEYAAMYPPQQIPLPPNYLPQHPFDPGVLQIRDELLEDTPRSPAAIQRHIADYYGMITHMDDGIGRIHEALRQNGLAENTIAIHTADHGLAVGRHGLMGKQNMYEHSLRVPLLMKGPDISQGQQHDALCYTPDLFPTLCEMAGVGVPPSNEMQSLLPVLCGETAEHRSTLFAAYGDCQRAVIHGPWKLIEYSVDGVRTKQLFDLEHDPHERKNLADDPAYQQIAEPLEAQLGQW